VLPHPRCSERPGSALWRLRPTWVTIREMRRTVVIVDDHARFRRSARKLLELEGFDVVGEAVDGASGRAVVDDLQPDLVLVDVGLPDTSGFDLARELSLTASVVLVSSRDPVDVVGRVGSSGALAFIGKDALTGEAIAAALEGRS
jgi:DNA-binding NarL/FixJ family response regulator